MLPALSGFEVEFSDEECYTFSALSKIIEDFRLERNSQAQWNKFSTMLNTYIHDRSIVFSCKIFFNASRCELSYRRPSLDNTARSKR